MDEYEKEEKKKTAVIEFRTIQIGGLSIFNDWKKTLPPEENPIALAIGSDWCGVYTSLSYLRIFSFFGMEKFVFSLTNSVIAMTGYENHLVYAYNSSVPLYGSQMLRFKILDSRSMFNEVYDGILPLAPSSSLIWFGYSEDGVLFSYDSYNILRGFFYNVTNNWIPLLDIGEIYENQSTNFWVIGVEDEEVYGIEIKGNSIEPPAYPHPLQKTHKFKIPFEDASLEEKNFSRYLMIKYQENRWNRFKDIKTLRSDKMPEYYYTDNIKDDGDLKLLKKDHDKNILTCMNDMIIKGSSERVIDLFDCLINSKSRELAVSMCNEYKQASLAYYLTYKMKLLQLKDDISVGATQQRSLIKENEMKREENPSEEKTVGLHSYALNLENFKSLEEEVRNELQFEENGNMQTIPMERKQSNTLNNTLTAINPFMKTQEMNLNKQNSLSLFEDLSKLSSVGVHGTVTNNNNSSVNNPTSKSEHNFKDVKTKIGFKRKSNEMNATNVNKINDAPQQIGKKMKKI